VESKCSFNSQIIIIKIIVKDYYNDNLTNKLIKRSNYSNIFEQYSSIYKIWNCEPI